MKLTPTATYRVTARRPVGRPASSPASVRAVPIVVTVTIEHGQVRTDGELDPADVVREAVEYLLPPGYLVERAITIDPLPVQLSRKK